jgi:hypothetical protein
MAIYAILFLVTLLAAVLLILEYKECEDMGSGILSSICPLLNRKEVKTTCIIVLIAGMVLLSLMARLRRMKSFFSDAIRLF